MEKIKITYYSEFSKDYAKDLMAVKTFQDLKNVVTKWKEFVYDAYEKIIQMDEKDFIKFQKGQAEEQKGIYSGDKWSEEFAMILVPEFLLNIGLRSIQLRVMEGTLFIRAKEMKMIITKKGKYGQYYIWKK